MQLKVKSKAFYPSHGAGWVKRKKNIEFNGEKKKYFEFEFINNPLTISTPIDNIDNLGIRSINPKKIIKGAMTTLKRRKTKKIDTKDFNTIINTLKDLEETGDIGCFVEIIQHCNYIIKEREKEGRLIPVSIEKQLDNACGNIAGEWAVASDIAYEKAKKTFEKTTGIEMKDD